MSISSSLRLRPSRRILAFSIATLAGCAILPQTYGATETWVGATSGLWNDGTNWTGPNLPPVSGDALIFGTAGAGGLLLNNNLTDVNFSIAGFTFSAGASAFVIGDGTANVNSGNPFILSGDILNSSTSLETINDPFSIAATRTVTTVATGGVTLNGVISGAGGLIAAGAGTTTLSQLETYSGDTVVNGGTLVLSRATNDGAGNIRGTLTINTGATVNATGINVLGYNGTQVTTVNVIGGTFDSTVAGDQGYNQTWNLTGGTIRTNGGTSSNTATGAFQFGPNTVVTTAASGNQSVIAGRVNLRQGGGTHPDQTFTVAEGDAFNDLLISAAITQDAAVGLTKAGPGTLSLTGTNLFTGNVVVNSGLLSSDSGSGLGSLVAGRTVTVNANSTLRLTVNNIFGGGPGPANPVLNVNGGTLYATRYNVSGSAGTSNGLTLQNGGTLSLGGTTDGAIYSNWQFGDLVTAGGTAPNLIVGTGAIASKANLFATGGTTFNVTSTGGAAGTADLTVADILGDQGNTGAAVSAGLKKTGAGTLLLSGANVYTGGTTVSAGTLALNNNNSLGTGAVTMAGGTLQLRGVVNAISVNFVGGNTGAAVTGATLYGVVPVTGANFNNLTGATGTSGSLIDSNGTATGATLTYNANGGSYSTTSANQLLNGYIDNQSAAGSQNVTVSGLGFGSYSVYAYFGSDVAGRTGSVKIGGTTYYYETLAGAFGYLPTASTTAGTSPYANYAAFSGLSGSTFSLDQFRGSNNSGLTGLQIVSNTTLPQTLTNALTVTADSTVDITGPASSALTGALSIGANTLTVSGGSTGANVPYSLNLAGTGGVTLTASPVFNVLNNGTGLGSLTLGAIGTSANGISKIGPGALFLPGANTYTGPTNVSAGTTTVSGSLTGTSGLAVTGGGTLLLAGATESGGNPVGTVNNSATVAVGGSIPVSTLQLSGTLASSQIETLGALTLSSNSALDFGGTDAASANTTNTLTFASLAALSGSGFSVLHWSGSLYSAGSTAESGTPAQDRLLFATLPGGGLASVESMANQLKFFNDSGALLGTGHAIAYSSGYEIVPIPEPSVLYTGLLATGLIGLRERRRWRGLLGSR